MARPEPVPIRSMPTSVEIAKTRSSQSSCATASEPGVTTTPKPCIPPMSWAPSVRRSYRRSGELVESGADLREPCLELRRPNEVGAALEIAPELPLVEAQRQLAPGSLVERVALRPGAELSPKGDELVVVRCARHEVLAEPPMERIVEVVGRERRELVDERRVPDDSGEQVAFPLQSGLEQAGRCRVGGGRRA